MNHLSPRRSSLLAALLLCCAVAPFAAQGAERGPARSTAGTAQASEAVELEARVIVRYRADGTLMRKQSASGATARPQYASVLAQRLGVLLADGRVLGARTQVLRGTGLTSKELVARLAAQSDVEEVVVDQRRRAFSVPNDPLYLGAQTATTPAVGQWYLRAPDATVVSSINAEPAWDVTTGNSSVVVAVLDTGVRFDHPDLASKLLPGYDFVSNAATAADGQATVASNRDADASDPGDFVTAADVGTVSGCTTADIGNSSWHGTHTAGLVGAATNNLVGMASVGWNVMVQPVRVLGKCGGFDSDIQAAMMWAGGLSVDGVPANPNPAKVINLSLGGTGSCSSGYQSVINSLAARNVVVVVAAGNDGLAVGSPGNCAGVITVGGVRHAGTKVGYSDLGAFVTISAPAGNCVNTTTGSDCLYPLLTTGNSGTTLPVAGAAGATYTTSGADASLGTSFAAPLVSGTVALMLSANPSLTPAAIKTALTSTSRAFPSTSTDATVLACTLPTSTAQNSECICSVGICGAGLLDAGAAVNAILAATAKITASATSVTTGTDVTVDGTTSTASRPSSAISSYQWSIVSGPATITGSTTGTTATIHPTAAGTVVVGLTVVDSSAKSNTTNITITVTAPVPATPAASATTGGGALNAGWLIALLGAVFAVWRVSRRKA